MALQLLKAATQQRKTGRLLAIYAGTLFALSTPARSAGAVVCPGDCSGDGMVAVNEIVLMVNIALGSGTAGQCPAGDTNADQEIAVDEIVAAVNAALNGCVAAPTPTPSPSLTAIPSRTATPSPTPTTAGITGDWSGTITVHSGGDTFDLDLIFHFVQSGSNLSGAFESDGGSGTLAGKVNGNSVTFRLTITDPECRGSANVQGTLNGDSLGLSFSGSNCGGGFNGQGNVTRA